MLDRNNNSHRMIIWLGLAAATLAAALALLVLGVLGLRDMSVRNAKTEGTVTLVGEAKPRAGGTRADVQYRLTVNGRVYGGELENVPVRAMSREPDFSRPLDQQGVTMPLYYDPADPTTIATWKPNFSGWLALGIMAGVVMIACGGAAIGIFRFWWFVRQQEQAGYQVYYGPDAEGYELVARGRRGRR